MLLLLLPNTDRLQQVEDYVTGYTWQWRLILGLYNLFNLTQYMGVIIQ
jgi:hypothetical protein